MQHRTPNRYQITLAILLFYFGPLLLASWYVQNLLPLSQSWNFFAGGILLAVCGSTILFLLMRQWETSLNGQELVNDIPSAESLTGPNLEQELKELQQQAGKLKEDLKIHEEALQASRQEHENCRNELDQALDQLKSEQESAKEILEETEQSLQECQKAIQEQRLYIENQQQQIVTLEGRERELNYELKTLLQYSHGDDTYDLGYALPDETLMMVAESKVPYIRKSPDTTLPESPAQAALILLRRGIEAASRIEGTHSFGSGFKLGTDYLALEQRRLFDHLRGESEAVVFVYSSKEQKILFANNQVKQLLGWTPDKFAQSFSEIIQEGVEGWNQAIQQLAHLPEATFKMPFKKREGEKTSLNCVLGAVPSGLFQDYMIIVAYSDTL